MPWPEPQRFKFSDNGKNGRKAPARMGLASNPHCIGARLDLTYSKIAATGRLGQNGALEDRRILLGPTRQNHWLRKVIDNSLRWSILRAENPSPE